ncbi:hypothetical protein F3D3_3174 [Fusibacter sp. 3D3]|nr:hypothetical protein F3D3_3174 [Fusibacter sp. 3D3]
MHKSNFSWNEIITDENPEMLQFLVVCLAGEFGETANIIKKVIRGDFKLSEVKSQLSEEIIDIFIYVIKLAYQLNIDIENEFLAKHRKNTERFKKYEMGLDNE